MTKIYCERKQSRYTLAAEGHAAGSPEACAGVSALTNALLLYALNETGHVRAIHAMEEGEALFQLCFTGDDAAGEVWKAAVLGLASIAKAYPEQVQMEGV